MIFCIHVLVHNINHAVPALIKKRDVCLKQDPFILINAMCELEDKLNINYQRGSGLSQQLRLNIYGV